MNRINQTLKQLASGASKAVSLAIFACFTLGSGNLFAQSWTPLPKDHIPFDVTRGSATSGPDGKVYIVGGMPGNQPQLPLQGSDKFHRYDVTGGTGFWTELPSLKTARWNHATVTGCDGKIYVIGGSNYPQQGQWNSLKSVETFSLAATDWVKKDYSLFEGPTSLAQGRVVAAVGSDCKIYAFKAQYSSIHMAVFDSTNVFKGQDKWTFPSQTNIYEPVIYGAVSGHNGKIYVLGSNDVHVFDPVNSGWISTPISGLPYPYVSTLGVDGNIYLLGGTMAVAIQPAPQPVLLSPQPDALTWMYPHSDGMAATAEGRVFALGPDDQYDESYGPLKAAVGPYKVWWKFNNATATGDFPKSASDPIACVFSPGLSGSNRVPGRVGNAAHFDPAIPSGQNIHVVNQPSCADIANGDFSIEFWMKHNGTANSIVQSILDKRSSDFNGYGYHVALYQGRIALQMANGSKRQQSKFLDVPFVPPYPPESVDARGDHRASWCERWWKDLAEWRACPPVHPADGDIVEPNDGTENRRS